MGDQRSEQFPAEGEARRKCGIGNVRGRRPLRLPSTCFEVRGKTEILLPNDPWRSQKNKTGHDLELNFYLQTIRSGGRLYSGRVMLSNRYKIQHRCDPLPLTSRAIAGISSAC